MFKNLFTKTLYDKKNFIVGWSLGLIAMISLTLAFYPSLSQGNGIEELFKTIPKQLQSLVGDIEAYRTAGGYLGSAVFELRVPLIALPMAIVLGIGLSVTEETSGQLYQLLAQPISRSKIVVSKWLAFVFCMACIHSTGFIGVEATLAAINRTASVTLVFNLLFMSFLLCLAVGSTTMLLGFWLGKKGVATAAASLIAFGSYLITSFASQVSWLKGVDHASFFHYYHASAVAKNGLNNQHVATLVVLSVVLSALAVTGFSRRDIGTSA